MIQEGKFFEDQQKLVFKVAQAFGETEDTKQSEFLGHKVLIRSVVW